MSMCRAWMEREAKQKGDAKGSKAEQSNSKLVSSMVPSSPVG